jgi:FtsP/CotA-like multicopper oxidase with cupredoxin domain
MGSRLLRALSVVSVLVGFATWSGAQSFRVQCPTSTITHPNATANNAEPPYLGPTQFSTVSVNGTQGGYVAPVANTVNGAIKCQQISGGDGFSTMGDGTQTFMFSFGPLSGLADIASGKAGTEFPNVFNTVFTGTLDPGDPAMTDGATSGGLPWTGFSGTTTSPNTTPFTPAFSYNGAVGLTPEVANTVAISDAIEGALPASATNPGCPAPGPNTVTLYTFEPLGLVPGSPVLISNLSTAGYNGTYDITCVGSNVTAPSGFSEYSITYQDPTSGLAALSLVTVGTASTLPQLDGHVDPRQIMDVGVMNGNIPAPLIAVDEDDEFFLTLTNVGMIMRPDLFEQHTVHWHGYPNASAFYDGVPDASVAINIGGSFTYYYLAPDAGTYFYHCHITPPEHLQMGMVGQLYVRPRQDRVPQGTSLYAALQQQNGLTSVMDMRTACNTAVDILCSETMPATTNTVTQGVDKLGNPQEYVFNDGDGSTAYDTEYPLQMHDFDPNFHFVGMTFNPEMFVDMKDKYFMLNGRSYPDTVGTTGGEKTFSVAPGPQATQTSDGQLHYSQPLPALINIPVGGKAAIRLSNLSVDDYHTLESLGVPIKVVGWNAKLLRDQAGNNTEYYTNSITLGGGESMDAILDASDAGCGYSGCAANLYPAGSVFYLFTSQLDHLSNDAENFGGMMTEVHICNSVSGGNTFGNTCN